LKQNDKMYHFPADTPLTADLQAALLPEKERSIFLPEDPRLAIKRWGYPRNRLVVQIQQNINFQNFSMQDLQSYVAGAKVTSEKIIEQL